MQQEDLKQIKKIIGDNNEKVFKKIDEKFKENNFEIFKKIDEKLDEVEDRIVQSVKQSFDAVDERLVNVERGQEEIKLKLDNVAYRFELVELQRRVDILEKKLNLK